MPKAQLDQKLLIKLAKATGRSVQSVREQISRRASRMGISSEAAQILLAKEFGIGTAGFQRSLPAHMQDQVRATLPTLFAPPVAAQKGKPGKAAAKLKGGDPVKLAIDYFLEDTELKRRCGDLLRAKGKFDRVFREGTTVLEDRLRKVGGITGKMDPADLTAKVINPDPDKAILRMTDDPAEQRGHFSICQGLFLAFRNPTHHRLTDKFTREQALQFCGSVDTMLKVIGQARKNAPES